MRFTASAFRKLLSIYVFSFGFEDRIWDLIVSVPDHCLSFYSTLDVAQIVVFPFPPEQIDLQTLTTDRTSVLLSVVYPTEKKKLQQEISLFSPRPCIMVFVKF